MCRKFITTLFALVILAPQICTLAYADQAQDRALMDAVSKGDVDAVKHLLSAGRNVDAVIGGLDQPPINFAAAMDKTEVVKAMIVASAKVDAIDKYGYQPIHFAAEAGNVELVQALLAAGAKVDAPNKNGAQPIHLAAKSGNGELVKILLRLGAKVDAKDNKGNTPFYYDTYQDDSGSVKKILLAAGAKEVKTISANLKPIWQEHIGPQISLGVSDKLMLKQHYIAKYIIKCETGKTYSVEKTATAGNSPETWQVTFPQDFHSDIKGLDIQQAYGCGLSKLTWTIYADDILIDSGTLISARKGSR